METNMNTMLVRIFNIPVYLLMYVILIGYIIAAAFTIPGDASDDDKYNALNKDFDTYIWPLLEKTSILINCVCWFLIVRVVLF